MALSRTYIARTSEGSRRSSIWANSTSTALLAQDLFSTRSGRSSPLGTVSGVYVQLYLAIILMVLLTAKGHPLPQFPCPIDMPDDFFRLRLVCVLLDTCGMCFDRGSQKRKLDNWLVFFQVCLTSIRHRGLRTIGPPSP